MIVTFCGHSNFTPTNDFRIKLMQTLESKINNSDVDFYLGGYGSFDEFARKCCVEYQSQHNNAKLYFITPYLDPTYLKIEKNGLKNNLTVSFLLIHNPHQSAYQFFGVITIWLNNRIWLLRI